MRLKFFILFLFLFFLFCRSSIAASSWQMQVDFYNIMTEWNNSQHRYPSYADYLYISFTNASNSYTFQVWQDGQRTGHYEGYYYGNVQSYVHYMSLGDHYTGYDALYSNNITYIYGSVNAIDPSNIAFAGNYNYFIDATFFYPEFPVWNVLGGCWAGVMVDAQSGLRYWVGTGDCYDFGYPTSTPTSIIPSPTPTPTLTQPTLTPLQPTPTPTPDLVSTPTPSQPTPTSMPPQSTPTPLPYPVYSPAPIVVYNTPVYSFTVVPTPTDNGTVLDSDIDGIEYNSQVPDKGQDLTEDDSWLDTIFDLFSNHPLVDVIKGSKITTSGELCSLSVNLYGSVIEISFCDLVDYVEIFGYFVTVCASVYAYFIIFRVS